MNTTNNYNLLKPEKTDYYNIEDQNNNMNIIDEALRNKVQKIDGKGLSTEDYTTSEKTKLAKIYDWAMDKFALIGHNHDTSYSNLSHDHNAVYLLKAEKAIDSDKLDGKDSTAFANSNHNHDSRYERIISKKSGFNLDKSDSVTSTSTSILATVKAVKTAYDKAVQALNAANSKLEKDYGGILSTSTSYTLNTNYRNRVIIANSSTNRVITVPSGIFEKGTQITIIRAGSGTVTLSTSGGLALYSTENKRSIKNQYGSVTIVFSSGSVAYLIGSLE